MVGVKWPLEEEEGLEDTVDLVLCVAALLEGLPDGTRDGVETALAVTMLGVGVSVLAVEGVTRPVEVDEELGLMEGAKEGVEAVLALEAPLPVACVVGESEGLQLELGEEEGVAVCRLEGVMLGDMDEDIQGEGEEVAEILFAPVREAHAVREVEGDAEKH